MPISRMARLGPFNINISAGYLHLRMTHVLSPQSLRPSWREYRPARACPALHGLAPIGARSEEHTSELQSLMRISYAVFCLKKKKKETNTPIHKHTLINTIKLTIIIINNNKHKIQQVSYI